jgi:3-methyladenine DNA glycosylase AlkD
LRAEAKKIGTDHDLALALWKSGGHEPRMMAIFLADHAVMTCEQAGDWVCATDNWAICDTACFHLYDRTDWRWTPIRAWAADEAEYVRRAGFAMLWALSVHDKVAPDACFIDQLDLFAAFATDRRTYVKKAIDMALRAVGKRNPALNAAAISTAEELAAMSDPTAAWIGRHTLAELQGDKVQIRLARGKAQGR